MRKTISLMTAVFSLSISGCVNFSGPGPSRDIAVLDYAYSNAGRVGTQNAGLYGPGSFFIWDTKTNQLDFIESLNLSPRQRGNAGTVVSGSVGGISIKGLPLDRLGLQNASLVEGSVGAQSRFTLQNAYREDYSGTISALSEYTAELVREGQDPNRLFRPNEPGVLVLIIHSVLRAQNSSLQIGSTQSVTDSDIVTVKVRLPGVADLVDVSMRVGKDESCRLPDGGDLDALPACFFNLRVYDPNYIPGNPRLQWDTATGYDSSKLPNAFRSLR